MIERHERNGDDSDSDERLVVEMRATCAAWACRAGLRHDRLALFDRQVERLANGQDVEAWTHPQSGAVVPAADRPRMLGLGLRNLGEGTSHTLRGGVMYAVAKHYRTPPAVPGTEHAAVLARGTAGENPGRNRLPQVYGAAPIAVGVVVEGAELTSVTDRVEGWEREHPEECATLREWVARQLATDVGGRQISARMLRAIGQTQYRHLVLQQLRAGSQRTAPLRHSGE